jgi:hypothetical protein
VFDSAREAPPAREAMASIGFSHLGLPVGQC